jgi:hypothetical protein
METQLSGTRLAGTQSVEKQFAETQGTEPQNTENTEAASSSQETAVADKQTETEGEGKIDEKMREKILINVAPLVGSFAVAGIVAAASALLEKLSATNVKNSTMAGDQALAPTTQDTSVSNVGVSGTETNAALSQDTANVNEGNVNAAQTEAVVQDTGLEASSTQGSAVGVEQGAVHTDTSALTLS